MVDTGGPPLASAREYVDAVEDVFALGKEWMLIYAPGVRFDLTSLELAIRLGEAATARKRDQDDWTRRREVT